MTDELTACVDRVRAFGPSRIEARAESGEERVWTLVEGFRAGKPYSFCASHVFAESMEQAQGWADAVNAEVAR